MQINRVSGNAVILPFDGELDAVERLHLLGAIAEAPHQAWLVVLDCTFLSEVTDLALIELFELRMELRQLGRVKMMLRLPQPVRSGHRSTRLIPAQPHVMLAHLARLGRREPRITQPEAGFSLTLYAGAL